MGPETGQRGKWKDKQAWFNILSILTHLYNYNFPKNKKKLNTFLKIFILTSITTFYHEWMNLIQQAFIIMDNNWLLKQEQLMKRKARPAFMVVLKNRNFKLQFDFRYLLVQF